MKIDDKVIEEIRNSASISEVIGHYIPIIKKGHNYVALCPFHDDHNPSLSIAEDKKIFKCFVCGKGGNVFNFVMDYTKCSYPEAIIEVAKIIGKPLDIDYKKPQKVSKYQRYYDLMQESIKFSNYALLTYAGEKAMDYLLRRGIQKEMIDYFEIGYNPGGEVLGRYLKKKGYSDADLETAGVCRIGDYGMHDIFAGRITFPIHDENGNPVAFSARAFEEGVAKYINTSETKIYHKGDIVYNFHRAKKEAKRADRVIVCEGVMDVIALKRANITNAVATLGTACTPKQLKLINALSRHFVFFYDGDKAGRVATMKACEQAYSLGYEPSVIVNDTDMDPDEILSRGEAKDLRDVTSKEITGIEFAFAYYKDLYPFHSYSNRKAYMRKLSTLIAFIKSDYDRQNFYHELVSITGLPLENEKQTKKEYNIMRQQPQMGKETLDGLTKAEYTIIKQTMTSKKALDKFRRELGCLYSEECERLIEEIIDDYRRYGDIDAARLLDEISDESIKDLLIKIEMAEEIGSEYKEDIFEGAILKVKETIKKARLEDLKIKIKETSGAKMSEYLREYTDLIKELGGKRNGR